jgi:hypothetical protein
MVRVMDLEAMAMQIEEIMEIGRRFSICKRKLEERGRFWRIEVEFWIKDNLICKRKKNNLIKRKDFNRIG